MGFFGRKKNINIGDQSVVSALTNADGTTNDNDIDIEDDYVAPSAGDDGNSNIRRNSDISDDYVAPDLDDIEGAAAAASTTADEEAAGTATELPMLKEQPSTDGSTGTAAEAVSSMIEAAASVYKEADAAATVALGLELDSEKQQRLELENRQPSQTSAESLSRQVNVGDVEDGYVNAGNETKNQPMKEDQTTDKAEEGAEKEPFDGIKGTVQPPKYKDAKYMLLFFLHFGVTAWWFVDSFIPVKTYNEYYDAYYIKMKIRHLPLLGFVSFASFTGLGLTFLAFAYMLRHGESMLKTTILSSIGLSLGVGLMGLFVGERFTCVCGLVAFAIAMMYANTVWRRIPFTAINLSVAIAAVRDNIGVFAAALLVAAFAFVWFAVAITAGATGYKSVGGWSWAYIIFSYYWTHQVLTNVLSVATAGIIGRWFVIGEGTPSYTTGMKDMLGRARTYSFGSICFGSLFFGMVQIFQGLSNFLWKKGVPLLPQILDWILLKINYVIDDVSDLAFVHVGLYGYSYTAAGKNVTTLLQNNEWDGIVRYHLAGNILFMANTAIGLLTGFCGFLFGTFEYRAMWKSGLTNPTVDGFFVGFLAGFLMSSIILSVVTATMNTLVVCMAESPDEFRNNHPDLSKKMEGAWKDKVEETLSEM